MKQDEQNALWNGSIEHGLAGYGKYLQSHFVQL